MMEPAPVSRPRRSVVATPCVTRVAFHGLTIEIDTPSVQLSRHLDIPFGGYGLPEQNARVDFRVVARPSEESNGWEVAVGDRRFDKIADAQIATLKTEWAMVTEALPRLSNLVHVHAGVVAPPGGEQSILIVGSSGRGKSTTTVALALAGCALYTDDVALIDRQTLRPLTVPRPIKLDVSSRRRLARFGLLVPPVHRFREFVARTALPGLPPLDALGPPLRTAFFLHPSDRTRVSVEPLSAAEAAMRLIYHSTSETLGPGKLDGGAFVVANALKSYSLTTGPLEETVKTILDVASRTASGAEPIRLTA